MVVHADVNKTMNTHSAAIVPLSGGEEGEKQVLYYVHRFYPTTNCSLYGINILKTLLSAYTDDFEDDPLRHCTTPNQINNNNTMTTTSGPLGQYT